VKSTFATIKMETVKKGNSNETATLMEKKDASKQWPTRRTTKPITAQQPTDCHKGSSNSPRAVGEHNVQRLYPFEFIGNQSQIHQPFWICTNKTPG